MIRLNLLNLKTHRCNHSNWVSSGKKVKYPAGYFPYSNLNLGGKGMNALSDVFNFIGSCLSKVKKLKK